MKRKNKCIACRYKKDGVKTRRSLVHTCGINTGIFPPIDNEKEYYIGSECYDEILGPGAICVLSKSIEGVITIEYTIKTTVADFHKELDKVSKYFNISKDGIFN